MPRLNFLVRVAVCFLFIFLPLHTLDQWFYDHFFRLRGTTRKPTPFILVRVNDAKLYQAFGPARGRTEELTAEPKTHSLWYSEFYGQLLRTIQDQKPLLVIFTSFFEGIDRKGQPPPGADNLLFAAVLNEENKLVP